MVSKTNSIQKSAEGEFVITRVFNAPRELVWKAMTDPKHVVNWWGPRGFTTTIETMDVRVGGIWKHTMHGPKRESRVDPRVTLATLQPQDSARSILARLHDQDTRRAAS